MMLARMISMLAASTCTPTENVELYINLDSTKSFANYLPKAGTFIPSFIDSLASKVPKLSVGMAYFGDKPYRNTDECFRQIIPLTTDLTAVKEKALSLKQLFQGGDFPEDSLSAMAYAAGSAAGFSTPEDGDNTIR